MILDDQATGTGSQQIDTLIQPEIAAVIVAAVAASLGKPGRIKRIRYRSGSESVDMTWAKLGRHLIMTSHQPRH